MKITFINAPITPEMQAGSLKGVVNIPPLGIGYLAAVLEENNFKVSIIDCALNIQIKI